MQLTVLSNQITGSNSNSPSMNRKRAIEGLRKIGVDVIESDTPQSKIVMCWGWKRGVSLKKSGYRVLVMERGYIGDRMHYTSLGWDGLNGHAKFPHYPEDGGKRFLSHGGIIKPWLRGGKYILLLGQVRNDASLQNKDIGRWYLKTAEKLGQIYDLSVFFRPHPHAVRRGGYSGVKGLRNIAGSLEEAVAGALFTVAYNSNSCLDSILQGKPSYAGDRGTMVYDLCMKALDDVIYPEREDKLHALAWTQWSHNEVAEGIPFKKLLEMV
jgi:hypothetical protein